MTFKGATRAIRTMFPPPTSRSSLTLFFRGESPLPPRGGRWGDGNDSHHVTESGDHWLSSREGITLSQQLKSRRPVSLCPPPPFRPCRERAGEGVATASDVIHLPPPPPPPFDYRCPAREGRKGGKGREGGAFFEMRLDRPFTPLLFFQ